LAQLLAIDAALFEQWQEGRYENSLQVMLAKDCPDHHAAVLWQVTLHYHPDGHPSQQRDSHHLFFSSNTPLLTGMEAFAGKSDRIA